MFELHGFASIETRAVEPLEQMLRKGEIDKEVYVLRRLHADDEADTDRRQLGLHFDLTVPFARYVLENAGHLDFPFRRYQIQKAWRGERPQEGRFREFLQADIDVVGRDDAAVPLRGRAGAGDGRGATRAAVGCRRSIQVNNRKLFEGFYRGPRACETSPACCGPSTSSTRSGRRGGGDPAGGGRGDAEQAPACLELAATVRRTRRSSSGCAPWPSRTVSNTRCSTRACSSSRGSSRPPPSTRRGC